MRPAHTPGPWNFSLGSAPHHQGQVSSETTGATIAVTYADEGGHNARLIAQAPAMFAALQSLMAESQAMLSNAEFADGQGIILTQDAEAIEVSLETARAVIAEAVQS